MLGTTTVFTVLDVLIGSVTFSGSIIAAGKLQGFIPGQPIIFKGSRLLNVVLAVVAIVYFVVPAGSLPAWRTPSYSRMPADVPFASMPSSANRAPSSAAWRRIPGEPHSVRRRSARRGWLPSREKSRVESRLLKVYLRRRTS